ncbi:hypothetical protein QUF90_05720 [Desulfococcaceae bacterium HSG9]|nr:hypothetical protein [Desulfococcaceae bacterium HSG9]
MARTNIMMVGLGDLGGHVLEMLVSAPGARRIVTADINVGLSQDQYRGFWRFGTGLILLRVFFPFLKFYG